MDRISASIFLNAAEVVYVYDVINGKTSIGDPVDCHSHIFICLWLRYSSSTSGRTSQRVVTPGTMLVEEVYDRDFS
jgi:hypothetical protein